METAKIDTEIPEFLRRAKPPTDAVLLSTVVNDLGLVPVATAKAEAVAAANQSGETVTLRHPVTDKVLGTQKPEKPVSINDPKLAEHPIAKANAASWPTGAKAKAPAKPAKAGSKEAELRKMRESNLEENDVRKIPRTTAKTRTAAVKSKTKAKARSAARPAAKAKAKATTTAERQPRGMVVEILKMATRANGVSPAELNEKTGWKGAPWKWLFSNPKGNGYCDRWGYKFQVVQVDGETRYKATRKAA